MKIPIGNLYFMLLYAWDALDDSVDVQVDSESYAAPIDLLSRILVVRVERLLRTGLDRGYKQRTEELLGLRGRIDIGQSVKSRSMRLGRLVCEFDELDHATLHNQIIKATLARISKTENINPAIAQEVRSVERRLAHIDSIPLSDRVFDRVVPHRNTTQYRLPIQVCRLLYRQLVPIGKAGRYVFRGFTEERLAALFEEFLRNFYKREQKYFSQVKRERFSWNATSSDEGALEYLPGMETDISLLSLEERLVVEVKFYEEPLRSRYVDSKKTFLSGHLYQINAYLRNLEAIDNRRSRGLLIYPQVKDAFDFHYRLLDQQVRVAAVDLTLPAEALRERLLTLIEAPTS